MTLHHFYFDAILYARKTGQRYGQAMFNLLVDVRPDLSEQIRGTSMDIFYLTGPAANPTKWDAFCTFIETNWRTS